MIMEGKSSRTTYQLVHKAESRMMKPSLHRRPEQSAFRKTSGVVQSTYGTTDSINHKIECPNCALYERECARFCVTIDTGKWVPCDNGKADEIEAAACRRKMSRDWLNGIAGGTKEWGGGLSQEKKRTQTGQQGHLPPDTPPVSILTPLII